MPPEARRRAILEAAVRVFARKGAHATRVGDIAAEAGVSHGLLYHYFSSKDEVLETVIADSWGRLVDALRTVVEGDGEPDEKLRHVVAILLRSWRFEPDAVRVLVREVGRGPKLEAHVDELRDAFYSIRAIVEEGQSRGMFRKDVDARQASWVVYGAIEELLTGWALGTLPGSEEDVARAEQTVVAVVCGGLAVRAASTA
jgi:TetR/AcrR family transcriptional regulator, fatty acid metabolism regulator protein